MLGHSGLQFATVQSEQPIPQDKIKELASAAIVKRTQTAKKLSQLAGKRRRPAKLNEPAIQELTKNLADAYGFAAVPHTTKEHREVAEMVAAKWVPLDEFERQVLYKEEAEERIQELQKENADLRARIEQRVHELPRLKAIIRSALTRLAVDTQEKHVPEDWAVILLRRIESAREILKAET